MKIRSLCAAVLGTLMLSESAFALSCMRPDLVNTLEEVKASDKLYYVFVGTFTKAGYSKGVPRYHKSSGPNNPMQPQAPTVSSAGFEGYALAKNPRYDQPLTRFPIDIEISCAASWCGQVPNSDQTMIAFVEARPHQAPLLRIGPCPGMTFVAEAPKVQKVRECLDKTCVSETPNW